MIETRIPYSFTQDAGVNLSWADVLEGFDRRLLASDFVRDKALDELTEGSAQELVDLAISDPIDSVRGKVEQLASSESSRPGSSVLLYLLVAYLRKNERQTKRLLDLIEEVYADFGYPPCLAKAVRYMPTEVPDFGTLAANEQGLEANLDAYLATPPAHDSPRPTHQKRTP
jgi:hypothetical protein